AARPGRGMAGGTGGGSAGGMALGAAGVVTEGRLRDPPEIETVVFPVGCAGRAAPTSLVRHHAMDINVPIGCSEVAVYSGDIIVGDGKGVAVILRHLADDAALGYQQALLADFVAEKVKADRWTFELLSTQFRNA